MIENLDNDTFDAAIAPSSRPVLVDFWAEWCGPCKALAPLLDDIAFDFEGQVTIAKVNIVANETLADRFGVRTVPLLLLFKDGEPVERIVGSVSRTRLSAMLEAHL